MSLFQRLTLLALGELLWICGGRAQYGALAELLRTLALGRHNPAEQERLFETYRKSRHGG